MLSRISLAALALGLVATPLAAQLRPRSIPTGGRTLPDGTVIRQDGTVIRPDGTVIMRPDGSVARSSERTSQRGRSKIPPGHLPPRGMCRVWIDGVPPGQQPSVTDCATAERNRVANSRVIYGDDQAFPGRGKGKFKGRDVGDDDRWGRDDDDDRRGRYDHDDRYEARELSTRSSKNARKVARKGKHGDD